MNIFQKITSILKRKRLFGIYRNKIFYANTLSELTLINPKVQVDIKIFDRDSITRIIDKRNYKVFKNLSKYLDRGYIGFYAEIDNEIASYCWLSINNKINPNKFYYLPADSGYLFSGYTFEKYRGKNLHHFIMYKLSEYAFNNGIRIVYSDPEYDNMFAIKCHNQLKFKYAGETMSLVFLTKPIYSNFKKITEQLD